MTGKTLQLDERLQAYLRETSLREPAACRALRTRTLERDDAQMMSSPEQTQLLALIARLMNAHRMLEVGTFTGYTALWLALDSPEEATLLCLDHDEEVAGIAREAWRQAGVDERIELRIGDAADSLDALFEEEERGASTWDLAYIDADKENLGDYYEACVKLVRPGGLIVVDNTLWKGRVADPDADDAATCAVREFNALVYADERVDVSLVPIGDGVTFARRVE